MNLLLPLLGIGSLVLILNKKSSASTQPRYRTVVKFSRALTKEEQATVHSAVTPMLQASGAGYLEVQFLNATTLEIITDQPQQAIDIDQLEAYGNQAGVSVTGVQNERVS